MEAVGIILQALWPVISIFLGVMADVLLAPRGEPTEPARTDGPTDQEETAPKE